MTVSRHEQYHDTETKTAELKSAIILLIIYTCVFWTVTCQHVLCGKSQMNNGKDRFEWKIIKG